MSVRPPVQLRFGDDLVRRGARAADWREAVGIAGALLEKEYRDKLAAAGFEDIGLEVTRRYEADTMAGNISDAVRREIDGAVVSAFIRARKPAAPAKQ